MSSAGADIPVGDPGLLSASCPANYSGPTNPATGCPWYEMSYTASPSAAAASPSAFVVSTAVPAAPGP